MRTIFIILASIAALLAAIMSFLPFGSITLAPALLGLVFGYLALRMSKKGKGYPKFLIVVSLIAGLLAMVKPYIWETKVEADQQFELREEQSQQEAIKELEELESELEELESPNDSLP